MADESRLLRLWPTMQLYLSGDVVLHLGPLNYLYMHSKTPGAYCLGIYDNRSEGTLLGGITLRNMLVKVRAGLSLYWHPCCQQHLWQCPPP